MPPVPSPGSLDRRTSRRDESRVRFRRAITLVLMTFVVPGSAQLVAGRREVGRIALRVWLGVIGTVGLLLFVGWLSPSFVFWLLSNTVVLGLLRFVLMALAVGWALLFMDAWRLGQPLGLMQRQRLAMVGLNGFLCFSVAGSLLFASHVVSVQKDFIAAMFSSHTVTDSHHGRFNILLLGGDSGAGRWGLRPDSLNVASIDAETGKTVLVGLPRNMTNFRFKPGSVMAEQYPDGYDCDDCYLNSLATWAADHAALFPKSANAGVEATTEAVEGITGLDINYYAMVNLQGFKNLVNAVGGLTLNVRAPIPVGGLGSDVTGYIRPGVRKLNGFETLWFARSREAADDYSRMARQKCVMNAMLEQLSPKTVVLKFESIAKASEDLISTNLPASELDRFMQLALKARSKPVATLSLVPPMINTAAPDLDLIRAKVQAAISRSESGAAPAGKGKHRSFSRAQKETTGASVGNIHDGYAANQAADLSSAC